MAYAITEQNEERMQTSYKPTVIYRRVPKEVLYNG